MVGMIFSLPVIKQFSRYVVQKAKIPLSVMQHIPVFGTFSFNIGDKNLKYHSGLFDGVGRILFWKGAEFYETETATMIRKLISRSVTFFDVGANVGFFTMFAKTINPNISVHAFEPVPAVFSKMMYHIQKNRFTNGTFCNQVALGDSRGTVIFTIPKFTMAGASFSDGRVRLSGDEIRVSETTIDDYVQQKNISGIDIIKIDVEGFEPKVLRGAEKSFQRFRPIAICECLPECDVPFLEGFFREKGYSFFHLTISGPIQRTSILPDVTHQFQNYLFVPQEKLDFIR